MTASESLRQLLLPMFTGWRFQYGRWTDGVKTDRYAVLRPMGGSMAGLVRQPSFSLMLICPSIDGVTAPEIKAQEVINKLMTDSGSLAFVQPGEPIFWATDDGRPVAELTINTIINR